MRIIHTSCKYFVYVRVCVCTCKKKLKLFSVGFFHCLDDKKNKNPFKLYDRISYLIKIV